MKTFTRVLTLSLALAAAAIFSGCAYSGSEYRSTEVGLLGVVHSSSSAYLPVKPTSIRVKTGEIIPQSLPSGRKTSLLWGTLVITDY